MNYIILLPGLWTALLGAFKGWRVAFIYGFLPSLIFFPNYYIFKMPGLPELSFWSASIAMVFLFWLVQRAWARLRPASGDLVVLAYVSWCVLAEYNANGFKEAQTLAAKQALGILIPYALGRSMRQDSEMLWNSLKMMVLCAAFLFLFAPYEARMGNNPFDFWRNIMPNSDWAGALYRNGAKRVVGSFSHSICYGYFAMMMLPIAIWLHVTRSFASQWYSRATIFLCLVGLILSGSRGAALGAAISVGTTFVLWSPRRNYWIPLALAGALVGGLLVYPAVYELMQMNRNEGSSESAQTAAYRADMIRSYIEVCKARPWFGFGRENVPVLDNMKSIDNQYLWLSLTWGFPAAALLTLSALGGIANQLPSVFRGVPVYPWRKFDAVLVGILIGAIGVQATVFAGTQTEQVFFLLVGMSGAPKMIGNVFGQAHVTEELPALVTGEIAFVPHTPWLSDWWHTPGIHSQAGRHTVLQPEVALVESTASGRETVATPASFTCNECEMYPPYEEKHASQPKPWFTRFYDKLFHRNLVLKPSCRKCGRFRSCGLARRCDAERHEL